MTMSEMIRKLHDFFQIFTRSGLNISEKDPQVRADYYASNLPFAITAGILICMLSLIGLIGTFAPYSGNQRNRCLFRDFSHKCHLHFTALQGDEAPPDSRREADADDLHGFSQCQYGAGQPDFLYDTGKQQLLL